MTRMAVHGNAGTRVRQTGRTGPVWAEEKKSIRQKEKWQRRRRRRRRRRRISIENGEGRGAEEGCGESERECV